MLLYTEHIQCKAPVEVTTIILGISVDNFPKFYLFNKTIIRQFPQYPFSTNIQTIDWMLTLTGRGGGFGCAGSAGCTGSIGLGTGVSSVSTGSACCCACCCCCWCCCCCCCTCSISGVWAVKLSSASLADKSSLLGVSPDTLIQKWCKLGAQCCCLQGIRHTL